MSVYDIALSMIPEIGGVRGKNLIESVGSAEKVFNIPAEEIARLSGLSVKLTQKITENSYVLKSAAHEYRKMCDNGIDVIPMNDPRYPSLLRECPDPPIVLYVSGSTELNTGKFISIVGTRDMTGYGRETTQRFVRQLSTACPDAVIVSGLAIGIDITAHLAALEYGMKTVAVLGTDLLKISPTRHREYAERIINAGGAIVSEYHTSNIFSAKNFLARNRVIAGLSLGTVVVESKISGGSLSTARRALEYDRDVMAFPGRITDPCSEGTNRLIVKDGARMITNAVDALDIMKIESLVGIEELDGVRPQIKAVMNILDNRGAITKEELRSESALANDEFIKVLMELEQAGVITTKNAEVKLK